MFFRFLMLFGFLGLAGCASAPSGGECTDIISIGGGLLRFCQSHRQLDITEAGLDPEETATVRIIDDPVALKALQKGLSLRSDYKRSRRLISKACVVKDDTYISVRLKDLQRILEKRVDPHAT